MLDKAVHHCVGFAAARRTQHDGRTEGIHHIDPAVVPTLFVIEACGQIDRILAFDEPCFLHETLVLIVENILHQIVFQQTAHPQTAHQKADIACTDGNDIQPRHRFDRQRQSQYPPVQEKQHGPDGECRPYFSPSDFLSLDTLRTQTGQGKQQDGKQLRVQYGMEQPRRAVEVHQDFVHHTDVHAPQPDGFVAEPVHVHDH
ncbi:hypothetical protein HMPREF1860_01442 [Prevotella amnii]|uniref:Uncharacterized protein n=1 Tax=Prevotella amnii TaxID=419005 RepID=A0A134BBD3_9BACT|nr:hypothetical protein HMPREF1860_01442 [Prevotella amnii]